MLVEKLVVEIKTRRRPVSAFAVPLILKQKPDKKVVTVISRDNLRAVSGRGNDNIACVPILRSIMRAPI